MALLDRALDADSARAREASDALFGVLAEGLADRFDPRLSIPYAEIFSHAVARVDPSRHPDELTSRYQRLRTLRAFRGDADRVRRVFVLSRVTLGADVAVTSVLLDAAKRRFPAAEIILVGGAKSRQIFMADPRIQWLPVAYGRRATLQERLAIWPTLAASFSLPNSIVIDPDSRLTQLGLLPVCPEEDYFLFESRSYGEETQDSLTTLAQRWAAEVFDVPDAAAFVAPAQSEHCEAEPFIAVNLGVGENPAKRVPDPFEAELLRSLLRTGTRVVVDVGVDEEEERRARTAIAQCGAPEAWLRAWRGSFASFASIIASSRLYVGYDSAGQHAAAVLGTPLVTVFAGFVSSRAFARWSPTGPGPKEVVRVESPDPYVVLQQTVEAIERLGQR